MWLCLLFFSDRHIRIVVLCRFCRWLLLFYGLLSCDNVRIQIKWNYSDSNQYHYQLFCHDVRQKCWTVRFTVQISTAKNETKATTFGFLWATRFNYPGNFAISPEYAIKGASLLWYICTMSLCYLLGARDDHSYFAWANTSKSWENHISSMRSSNFKCTSDLFSLLRHNLSL